MPKTTDITGQRFGWLVAIERVDVVKKNARWLCLCDCGNSHIVQRSNLRYGSTKSCGCQHRVNAQAYRHGYILKGKYHPLYSIWVDMRRRCNNPQHQAFNNYGGRGINVCERWDKSFPDFLADVGARPGPEYSLDRYPDNDGNYEPGNVRWATMKEQSNNRRNGWIIRKSRPV